MITLFLLFPHWKKNEFATVLHIYYIHIFFYDLYNQVLNNALPKK